MILALISLTAVTTSCSARFPTLEEKSSWADGSLSIYYFDSDTRTTLKTICLDGTADRTLLDFPINEYEISASGTKIAFSDHSSKRCGVVDLISHDPLWIPTLCTDFELSPDGLSIAYVSNLAGGVPEDLRIFAVATKESHLVAQVGSLVGPRWSRNGREIFYSDLFTRKHYSVDLDRGDVTELGEADNISEFWRSRVGFDGMHFNQWDSSKYGWYHAVSPTGVHVAECKEGSLFVADQNSGEDRLLLRNTGSFNPDIGVMGFSNPVWTLDERYIVGEISGRIVVVEVGTGRSGIVTAGTHALAYIPGFRPSSSAAGEMYDSWVKLGR